MAKIFCTKFNVGSYGTKHGYFGAPSNAPFKKTEKGLAAHFSGDGYINYVETAQRLDTLLAIGQNFTGEIWFKIDATIPQQHIWAFTNQAGDRFVLGIQHHIATACTLRWSEYNGDEVSGGGLGWGRWYHCIFTCENDVLALYLNNVEQLGNVANGDHWSNNRFVIGASQALNDHEFNGQVAKLAFWDYVFTDAERDRSYEAFLAAQPVEELKFPRHNPHVKPHDLSYLPGILAAWNFILSSGNIFTDISDWGGNASNHGAIPTKDGIKLNGVDNTVRLWMAMAQGEAVKTVCFRIKLDSTTEVIVQGETADHLIYANAGTLTYSDYDTAYINGVETDDIAANQWTTVVVTSSTAVSWVTATLGLNDTTYGAFEIEDLRLFDYEFTLQQAKDYHNYFAKRVKLIDFFAYDPVGATKLRNTEIDSGSFALKEDAVGKYFECQATGAYSYMGVGLSPFYKSGWIKTLTGDLNADEEFCVDDASFLSFNNGALQLDMNTNELVRGITITENDPLLLIKDAVTFCDEYQAVYDALTTPPAASIANAQNTMVSTLVSGGVWAKFDLFYLFAQTTNAASEALLNWVSPGTFNATLVNAPTFVALEGFTGEDTKYINTNWVPRTDGINHILDGASAGCYIRNNTSCNGSDFAAAGGGGWSHLNARQVLGGHTSLRVNSLTSSLFVQSDSRGMWIINRTLSTHQDGYKNKVRVINEAVDSIILPNVSIYILCRNLGDAAEGFTDRQQSMFFAGGGLTQGDINILTDAVEVYMDSNSKGVIA